MTRVVTLMLQGGKLVFHEKTCKKTSKAENQIHLGNARSAVLHHPRSIEFPLVHEFHHFISKLLISMYLRLQFMHLAKALATQT